MFDTQILRHPVLCILKKHSEMMAWLILCLTPDQADLVPVLRDCRIESAWPSACCHLSWACRCYGNNNNFLVAGMTPFSGSVSLCCCLLWCGLWGFTCITAASGSTSRPLQFLSTSEFPSLIRSYVHVHARKHPCGNKKKCLDAYTNAWERKTASGIK